MKTEDLKVEETTMQDLLGTFAANQVLTQEAYDEDEDEDDWDDEDDEEEEDDDDDYV